ncbi:hypothetical protein M422DRAFT_52177 [Sphaerobolus stellatus SS14]|uniref:Uncharacterized protein n=1 Tax=Sphaerobolus stellatus (strain SS14) TaxID=990650 RepID=A0A0C9TUQ4_SPHS4|nr:hypothetical protein M422DRAFT_52177 [Sphaerobolus stellatus SS14]
MCQVLLPTNDIPILPRWSFLPIFVLRSGNSTLLEHIHHQELRVLPTNREYVAWATSFPTYTLGDLDLLVRGPITEGLSICPPFEFLVIEKIKKQNKAILKQREAWKYQVDQDNIRLIFGHKSLETLTTLLLEHVTKMLEIATKFNIDKLEFESVTSNLRSVAGLAAQRCSNLIEGDVLHRCKSLLEEEVKTHSRGIFHVFMDHYYGDLKDIPHWTLQEVQGRISINETKVLLSPTWEKHIQVHVGLVDTAIPASCTLPESNENDEFTGDSCSEVTPNSEDEEVRIPTRTS